MFDYQKARDFVSKFAEKAEREALKSEKYWDEEDTQEEKDENVEEATMIKEAVLIGGNLLIDIAESLNRAAPRSVSRGP